MKAIITTEKLGSISKAADFLGLSQPALSKAIKNIEQKLGVSLFTRLPRGIKISKEGEIYLRCFEENIQNLENAKKEVLKLKTDYTESVSISIHPILGQYIIPKIENELFDFSEIKRTYKFQSSRDGTQDVLKGEIDLAIVADPQDFPDLIIKTLWREYIALYSGDGEMKSTLLYHSQMISANKYLKQIQCQDIRAIDDYSIIYSVLKGSNFMALVPNSIVKEEDKVQEIDRYGSDIDVCLLYRVDKIKTKGFIKLLSVLSSHSSQIKLKDACPVIKL